MVNALALAAVVVLAALAFVAGVHADADHAGHDQLHRPHLHDHHHGETHQTEGHGSGDGDGDDRHWHQGAEDHEHEHGHPHHHHHQHHPHHPHPERMSPSLAGKHHGHEHDHGAEEEHEIHGKEFHGRESEHFHRHLEDGGQRMPTGSLWVKAMGCSLLVSLCSLICLLLLPLIAAHGKPSKPVVDALAGFGAGSMLGDALLHQLPHAFGGSGHSHHEHHEHHEPVHGGHGHGHGHGHAHSVEDLSVGLAVLGGILLFFVVEKIVRRTEELTVRGGHSSFGHSHHHHHHRLKKDEDQSAADQNQVQDATFSDTNEKNSASREGMRRRHNKPAEGVLATDQSGAGEGAREKETVEQDDGSRLVLGYLNLFSDGVHNFTDGMALGSAFLLHGAVGGWSRTLFLLAHELPQEVGDFGILLRSGFGVFQALAFNFLSALVALAGTALALLLGGNPGHSNLIEGFTAGGFIYIAIGAVMPDMHSQGSSLKTSVSQVAALGLGMGVAMTISLAE